MRLLLRLSTDLAHSFHPKAVSIGAVGFNLASPSSRRLQVSPILRPHPRVASFVTFVRPPERRSTRAEGVNHPAQARYSRYRVLTASSYGLWFLLAAALASSAYYIARPRQASSTEIRDLTEAFEDMAAETAPGRPGNLTPEQEEKLKRLWQLVFQVCGTGQEQNADTNSAAAAEKTQDAESKKTKKSRMSFFSRKSKKDADADSSSEAPGTPQVVLHLGKDGEGDKYGQTKQFYEALANQSPESIRDTIWSMVKHDHPDALLLRFLRARKWDVEKALIMLVSTMNWRAQEMKVDEDIMRNGEAAALADEKSADARTQKLGHDFMTQIRKGISYVHGVDKQGRPICFVNVRLHKQGEQDEAALERYTVYLIETCRMVLQAPIDTATIVFNMTDFSMANMDYTPVKFMIKCFEANYPESLGTVLVHKAPWIFQGIWKVIRGWLDPVVANKVHFTNNAKEMQEFIPLKHIPKDLEGEEDWTYAYVEPAEGENARLADAETRDRLLAAREGLYKEYEEATVEWIRSSAEENGKGEEIKKRRNEIAKRLREGYWEVDPYLRARSYYDRTGVLLPGGKLNWYPGSENGSAAGSVAEAEAAPASAPAAATGPETSADDVD